MTASGATAAGLLERMLAAGPELDRGPWALSPAGLELVLGEVAAGRELIVECGSGISTLLIARLLRERGAGSLYSLEHDPDCAALTRRRLAAEGLEERARVIEAPLQPHPLAPPGCEWYDRAALAELPDGGIALLLVDGPPASPRTGFDRSRYPALPLLASRLASGAAVIVDDVERPGEAWVLERWRRELGIRFRRDCDRIAIGAASREATLRAGLVRARSRLAEAGLRGHTRRAVNDLAASLGDLQVKLAQAHDALANHEQRIRRLAAVEAVSGWIEQATLAGEPLVSVITPTHKRIDELERAIRSVIAQSYANWEQLVVTDEGFPAAAEVVDRIGDARVRVVTASQRTTAPKRNHGLEQARGELVAYLDDDNTLHPGWLKSVVWGFEQRPEVEVLYGGWVIDDPAALIGEGGGTLPEFWVTPFDRELQLEQALADMSAIAHRAGLAEARFDETLAGYHDWDLLARLTAESDPLVLPVVACFYSTSGHDRMSLMTDRAEDGAIMRARILNRCMLRDDDPAEGRAEEERME